MCFISYTYHICIYQMNKTDLCELWYTVHSEFTCLRSKTSNDRMNDHLIIVYHGILSDFHWPLIASLYSSCIRLSLFLSDFHPGNLGASIGNVVKTNQKKHSLSLLIRVTSGRVQVCETATSPSIPIHVVWVHVIPQDTRCFLWQHHHSAQQNLPWTVHPSATKKTNTEITHGVSSARTVSKKNSWIDELT